MCERARARLMPLYEQIYLQLGMCLYIAQIPGWICVESGEVCPRVCFFLNQENEGKLHFSEFAFTKATIRYMTAMIANESVDMSVTIF